MNENHIQRHYFFLDKDYEEIIIDLYINNIKAKIGINMKKNVKLVITNNIYISCWVLYILLYSI